MTMSEAVDAPIAGSGLVVGHVGGLGDVDLVELAVAIDVDAGRGDLVDDVAGAVAVDVVHVDCDVAGDVELVFGGCFARLWGHGGQRSRRRVARYLYRGGSG